MAVVAGATDTLAILFGSGLLILNAGPLCSKGRDTAVTRCDFRLGWQPAVQAKRSISLIGTSRHFAVVRNLIATGAWHSGHGRTCCRLDPATNDRHRTLAHDMKVWVRLFVAGLLAW